MSDAPKIAEDNYTTLTEKWEELRSTKTFGGYTLGGFKAAIKPSVDARTEIKSLATKTTAQLDIRDNADVVTAKAVAKVIKGIVGDPEEGDDGELYDALGYVRKSERASGLSRKKNNPALSTDKPK